MSLTQSFEPLMDCGGIAHERRQRGLCQTRPLLNPLIARPQPLGLLRRQRQALELGLPFTITAIDDVPPAFFRRLFGGGSQPFKLGFGG